MGHKWGEDPQEGGGLGRGGSGGVGRETQTGDPGIIFN